MGRRLIFVGPPGAGKGTQAAILIDRYDIPHLSTGDMLRSAIAEGSELGKKVEGVMAAGDLVSDELMVGIIQERLSLKDCENGYILDGFPRTLAQAEALDNMLDKRCCGIDAVIYFEVNDQELFERVAERAKNSGRADDTADVLKSRLATYRQQTAPLLPYYEAKGLIRELDGMQSIEAVAEKIAQVLA